MKKSLLLIAITAFAFSTHSFASKTIDIYNKANLKPGQVWSVTVNISDQDGNGYITSYVYPWHNIKHQDTLPVDSIKTTQIDYCMGSTDKCSQSEMQSCQINDINGGNYNQIEVYLLPNNNCYSVFKL